MRKLAFILVLGLSLVGCKSASAPDNASRLEQGLTLGITIYTGYLHFPNCATPEGQAAKPACADSDIIAQAKPKRQAAFDNVSTYVAAVNGDPYYCTGVSDAMMATCLQVAAGPVPDTVLAQVLTAANSALSLFTQITSSMPRA